MPKKTDSNKTNHIRELRSSIGMRQAELAEKAGISRATLSGYEQANFTTRIPTEIQAAIAKALGTAQERVFPTALPQAETATTRRELLGTGLGIVGAGLAFGMGDPLAISTGMAPWLGNRRELGSDEQRALIDSNFSAWMLFDNLMKGTTIEYTTAIAQGNVTALKHLATCNLPTKQKSLMLLLQGDMLLLLGRIARETRNYGIGESYFQQAMAIANDIDNANLKSATRQRYGYMLIDAGRYGAAVRNADALLHDSERASFPIWAEAQLVAGHTFSHVNRIAEARVIAYKAREATPGLDPDIWTGNVTNPKAVHSFFDITANNAAGKYYDAYLASDATLSHIDQEQPDNLQFRVHIEMLQAQALWGLGDVANATLTAIHSLEVSRRIGSTVNEVRVEKLYHEMLQSPKSKHNSVRELGEIIGNN